MIRLIRAWWRRRGCYHHDVHGGASWIVEQMIDLGMRKYRWCTHCHKVWII